MAERLIRALNVNRDDRIVGDSEHRIGERHLDVIDTVRNGRRIAVVGWNTLGEIEHRTYESDELVAVVRRELIEAGRPRT